MLKKLCFIINKKIKFQIIISLSLSLLIIFSFFAISSIFRIPLLALINENSERPLIVYTNMQKLGKISVNTKIHTTFDLFNASSHEITIIGTKSSCGCIALDEIPFKLSPRSTQKLNFRISAPEKPTLYEENITLITNCENQKFINFYVSAQVIP